MGKQGKKAQRFRWKCWLAKAALLFLLSGAVAPAMLAEAGSMAVGEAEAVTRDGSVPKSIMGFAPWAAGEVVVESKPDMETLAEKLGSTVSVYLEGESGPQDIAVEWVCREGYENRQAGSYLFIPAWDEQEYALDAGAGEIPAKEVSVLDEIHRIPELTYRPVEGRDEVGSVTQDEDYIAPLQASIESRYNPLDKGVDTLPAIRNQAPYGSCWAFTSLAMGEIAAKRQGQDRDLSELHLSYFSYNSVTDPLGGFVGDSNKGLAGNFVEMGGNLYFAGMVLAGWVGAADESLAPYSDAELAILLGLDHSLAYQDTMHLQSAYVLSLATDERLVKQYIKKNGGVGVSYGHYDDAAFYNEENTAYYCSEKDVPNHAVTVVGWDDNFPAENFTTRPAGNGAWLIRNSWGGSGYNKYGYFWLSYYDRTLEDEVYVFEFEDADNYDHNYQYDGAMLTENITLYPGERAANVFTPRVSNGKGELLKAVSFYSGMANTKYKVEIYTYLEDPLNPSSGTLETASVTTGTTTGEGYYTVPLKKEIPLERGKPFSVVITLEKSAGNAEIGAEASARGSWYDITANAVSGQSFIDENGTWLDFGRYYDSNLRIKAFTEDVDYVPVTRVTLDYTDRTIDLNKKFGITAGIRPSNAADTAVTWESSNKNVATVTKQGVVTGVGFGEAVITATAGGRSAACRVTVRFPFSDITVTEGNWKYEGVKNAYLKGYMGAITGTDLFMPDRTLSRGMFVTILHRMVGAPAVAWSGRFSDVENGRWYTNAVLWAAQQGIVEGYTDGSFGVDDDITREQIAKILNIYAKQRKYDVSQARPVSSFTDVKEVSGWALPYMEWAVGTGVISGKPNQASGYRLDPKGKATRAECAAMMMRFGNYYGEE